MHECPDCGMVCTCDGDDLWEDDASGCTCCNGADEDTDDGWLDADDTSDEEIT